MSPLLRKELLLALAATKEPVRFVQLNGAIAVLPATTVAAKVSRNGAYTWRVRKSGVKHVTQHLEPVPMWAACWRTTKAAVCPPSLDWDPHSPPGTIVRSSPH